MQPLFSSYSQEPDGFKKSCEITEFEVNFLLELLGLVVFQEYSYSLIIMFWQIDGAENFFITFNEYLMIHLGNKVQRTICIVPRGITQQSSFIF